MKNDMAFSSRDRRYGAQGCISGSGGLLSCLIAAGKTKKNLLKYQPFNIYSESIIH